MFTTHERHRAPDAGPAATGDSKDCGWRAVGLKGPPNWYVVYLRKPGPPDPDPERCQLVFLTALRDLLMFKAPDRWAIVAAQFVSTNFDVPGMAEIHDLRRVLAWEAAGATDPTYLLELSGGKILSVSYESSAVLEEHRLRVLDELPVAWSLPRPRPHRTAHRNDA